MLAEQTFLNAGPLLVRATEGERGAAVAGFAFNVLLLARAPLVLFQAIQTSILPHLTRLWVGAADDGDADPFQRSVNLTLAAMASSRAPWRWSMAGRRAVSSWTSSSAATSTTTAVDSCSYRRDGSLPVRGHDQPGAARSGARPPGGGVLVRVGRPPASSASCSCPPSRPGALSRGRAARRRGGPVHAALHVVPSRLTLHEFVVIPARFNGPPGECQRRLHVRRARVPLGADVSQVSLRYAATARAPAAVTRGDGRVELARRRHARGRGRALGAPAGRARRRSTPTPPRPPRRPGARRGRPRTRSPTCVVCGPERAQGDGYRIFPGPWPAATASSPPVDPGRVAGRRRRHVRPECLWGALDCPTSAPVANFGQGPPVVLARLTARLGCAVRVGERTLARVLAARRSTGASARLPAPCSTRAGGCYARPRRSGSSSATPPA